MADDDDDLEELYGGIFSGGFANVPSGRPRSTRRRVWRQHAQTALTNIAGIALDVVTDEADELTADIIEIAERVRELPGPTPLHAFAAALGAIWRAFAGPNAARLMARFLEPLADSGVQRGMLLELD